MPEIHEEVKAVLDEMRTAHETFTTEVDKQLKEERTDPLQVEKIDKINEDITGLQTRYDELLKASQRPANTANPEETAEDALKRTAFDKFLRYGFGETGRAAMNEDEVRTLSSASDKDGGFLVPVTFENEIITQAYDEAELRPLVNVAPTGRDAVQLAALSKPVVAWGTRNLKVDEQMISAGGERIEIFDLKALTLIANNTLDDAAADVWGELRMMFGDAIAEAEDDAIASAAGDRMPQGVIASAEVQANFTNSGVAAALSDNTIDHNGIDPLITMLYSLKKTYRRNSTFAMNSTTEGVTRKFKDLDGQYYWQPPVQVGAPATLLGRPIANPEGLPDVAANSLPIVLGDFRKGYKLRDRAGVTVQRLVEKYAEYDQTGFLLKKRLGGQVVLPEAFRVLKVAA